MWEHRGNLERADHAAPGDVGRARGGNIVTCIDDPPGGRLEKLCQEIEHGRLAGAVRADQRMDGAAADFEIHCLHRGEAAELFRQPPSLEDQVVQARSLWSRYCFRCFATLIR